MLTVWGCCAGEGGFGGRGCIGVPGTGIHFMVGYELESDAEDAFWLGCFAPDYAENRALKDKIHFRDAENRLAALTMLRDAVDMSDPFERGWVLHLFADMRWDVSLLKQFREDYIGAAEDDGGWFWAYREELGRTTCYIYNHMPWVQWVWMQLEAVDIARIGTTLPVVLEELEQKRDRLVDMYRGSDAMVRPEYYDAKMLAGFARDTAEAFRAWCAQA